MQIICISRGSQSLGAELAEKLAANLGYECIGREQLLEEATRCKIPIGKLETSILKPHLFSEKLALELEHYKALATSILCEKALNKNIVYHGRTGHLLLQGVNHILKIRVVSDMEYRIKYIMQKLDLSRLKARRYIEQVEEDRRRWVKKFYNVEWDVFTLYDLVVNLSQMSVNNAASAICSMAQLPEFQATPASVNTLKDLYLSSKARLILASDESTSRINVKVRANNGIVYITYPIQQVKEAEVITRALKKLKEAKEIVCTKAETTILWIQETFDPEDSSYKEVLSLSNNWNAAVELIKLTLGDEPVDLPADEETEQRGFETWRETGIIDESDEESEKESADVSKVYERLINDGRAGGRKTIQGTQKTLLSAIDRSVNYRLIVFDNIFLSKGEAARKRLLREWSMLLSDSLKTPVITLSEIVSKYHFGLKQFIRMTLFAVFTAVIVFIVLNFEQEILAFISKEGFKWRVIATACILVFIPFFAFIYSAATGLFLKMIKLE